MNEIMDSLRSNLGDTLPGIMGALAILVVGWLVAVILRAVVRKSLRLIHLNDRVQSSSGSTVNLESGVAKGVYYVLLLLVLVAFFEALDLRLVSEPLRALTTDVFAFVPKLVAAGILLLVAWLLATVARKGVTLALGATKLDDRLSTAAGMRPVSQSLGNVLYWLIILLFLPAVLGALQLQGLLSPVQNMVEEILAMLPNVLGAVLIGVVGWFVAKILRDLVTNLLSAGGADGLGEKAGLQGTMSLSRLLGLVVYVFVLVPALIAALQALQIEAIAAPATSMLETLMVAIPNIFAAGLILAIAYFVGRLVAELVGNLLGGMGFDRIPETLGFGSAFPAAMSPSHLVARLTLFAIMLFASVEAANRLGFTQVSELVSTFLQFGGEVLLGLVIITLGIWISNVAHAAISRLHAGQPFLASLARFGIIGMVLAMGLRGMGLADDIVNLAFGLTLGSVAVAVALSFGLGGREAAGRQMEHWLARLRGDSAPRS